MKLSVIVPVFNMASGGKINFCLDSLLNQTLYDYEIITVNDASTDNSLEILYSYEKQYPDRIKVITYPDNRHQGGARNEALKVAKGEWISFVDSDDWVSPDYFEKLIAKGEETDADLVTCNFTTVNEQTFTPGQIYANTDISNTGIMDSDKRKKYMLNPGSVMICVYRRSLLYDNNIRFPEHIFYEDNATSPIIAMSVKHVEFAEGPLYYYYQHQTSTVHTITRERCENRLTSCGIMLSEVKKRGFYEEYKEEVEALFIRLYLVNTLFGYMIDGKAKEYSFVKKIKKGMLSQFPDFTNNKYYESIPDSEQKKMIKLLLKNSFAFYVYYRLLWWYRRLRKG